MNIFRATFHTVLLVVVLVLIGSIAFSVHATYTEAVSPIVSTLDVTGISQTSATLQGEVNPRGSATSVRFEYGPTWSLGSAVGSQSVGSGNGMVSYSFPLSNFQPNTTYYYRAVAQNQAGVSYGSIVSFTTHYQQIPYQQTSYYSQPSVQTNYPTGISPRSATFQGSVNPNGSHTTAWFEYGLSQNLGSTISIFSVGSGHGPQSANRFVSDLIPNTTYYYRLVAQNLSGTAYGNIINFNTGNDGLCYGNCNPCYYGSCAGYGSLPIAETKSTSLVYANSALVHGSVNPNGSHTDIWFEWGASTSLGNSTSRQPNGTGFGTHEVASAITGLQQSTAYYYRVAAQNAQGVSRGTILLFKTTGAVVPPPVYYPPYELPKTTPPPVYTTPVVSSSEVIALTVMADKTEPKAGDEVSLTISYRNNSTRNVKDALIRIVLPQEVEFRGSSVPAGLQTLNYAEFVIGTVSPNSQNAIVVRGKVREGLRGQSALMFHTTFMYRDSANRPGSVASIFTLPVEGEEVARRNDNGFLLASIFNSGIVGWLLVLLLILLLLLVIGWIVASTRPWRDRPMMVNVGQNPPGPRQTF